MPKLGRAYSFKDPALNRALAELFELVQQRKLGPESIDTRELTAELNRDQYGLWKLLQMGKAFFRKLVLGKREAVVDSTAIYVNNDDGVYTTGIHLDLDGSANSGPAIQVDMPGSPSQPVLSANTVTPSVAPVSFTGFSLGTATLDTAGAWTNACHSSGKRLLGQRSDEELDVIVDGLELYDWEPAHRPEGELRHFSPTAEAFYAATGLGTEQNISALDLSSLALRGLQRERARVRVLEEENESLTARVVQLEEAVQAFGGLI